MEKKSRLNPKQKRILNITIITLQVIFILVCIIFSIIMAVSSMGNKKGELNDIINLMPVMSNSMQGDNPDSFNTNDLILVKKLDDEGRKNLKVGDIVTFKAYEPKVKAMIYISHRIVEIDEHGRIITQGDYAKVISPDSKEILAPREIEGIYTGKVPKLGAVITFIKKPGPFFGLIVTPLALLLLYNVYLIIKAVLDNKFAKLENDKQEAIKQATMEALQAVGINVNNTVINNLSPVEQLDGTAQETVDVEKANVVAIEPPTEESEEEKKKRIIAEYLAEQERKKIEEEKRQAEEEQKKKIIEEYLAEQEKKDKE